MYDECTLSVPIFDFAAKNFILPKEYYARQEEFLFWPGEFISRLVNLFLAW